MSGYECEGLLGQYTKRQLAEMLAMVRLVPLTTPESVVAKAGRKLAAIRMEGQECFGVICLDHSLQYIRLHVVTRGTPDRTYAEPREVFRPAIADNASRVILFHNHPSGDESPSREDSEVTGRLVRAGDILGIEVIDHVILSPVGSFSFKENGMI